MHKIRAQRTILLTFRQENLEICIKEKGLHFDTDEFPFSNVSQFIICYIDDICIYSSKDYKNSTEIHLLLLEYVMYCTVKMGFKLSKGKTHVMPVSFKFLGHWFNTMTGSTSIPPLKLNAFLELRSPLSKAEAVSRLGTISYFASYVSLLRLISLPIQHMITSEKGFEWNRIHQRAFDSIKLLCSL